MNKLRKSVSNALKKLSEARKAVQDVEHNLTFCGFRGEEPEVTLCNDEEIILYYSGYEMPIDVAIDYMESKGYIDYNDFVYE